MLLFQKLERKQKMKGSNFRMFECLFERKWKKIENERKRRTN